MMAARSLYAQLQAEFNWSVILLHVFRSSNCIVWSMCIEFVSIIWITVIVSVCVSHSWRTRITDARSSRIYLHNIWCIILFISYCPLSPGITIPRTPYLPILAVYIHICWYNQANEYSRAPRPITSSWCRWSYTSNHILPIYLTRNYFTFIDSLIIISDTWMGQTLVLGW